MGLYPILAICLCLAGGVAFFAYLIREARDPRTSRLVLAVRAVAIVVMVGILAMGWVWRGVP